MEKKLSLNDFKQELPGDTVALFSGRYNPVHMDYLRSFDFLYKKKGISFIWACPLYNNSLNASDLNHIKNMSTVFCSEFSSSYRKIITCCTVAIDKKIDTEIKLLTWAKTSYPMLNFVLATMNPNPDCENPIIIKFAMQDPSTKPGSSVLFIKGFLAIGHGIQDKISSGSDESRNFTPGVWSYIQANKLYR